MSTNSRTVLIFDNYYLDNSWQIGMFITNAWKKITNIPFFTLILFFYNTVKSWLLEVQGEWMI